MIVGSKRFKSKAQQGLTLIEVLVAVLILSVGLLGMASMQSNSLQMTTGSLARSQAIFLANDIIDRVRANRSNRAEYNVAAADDDLPACDLEYEPDTAELLAVNDVSEWLNSVVCLLPSTEASVAIGAANNSIVVRILWQARNDIDGDGVIEIRSQL